MEEFRRSDIVAAPFISVSADMSNDKHSEVRHDTMTQLREPWCDRLRIGNDDVAGQTFTLPVQAARLEVRDILSRVPRHGYLEIVECWRQLPDGQIEFSTRRLPTSE